MRKFFKHCVGVSNNCEVGHLHHGAVGIGIHANDVLWLTQTAGVLHGATNAKRDVQIGINDNAGCADLAFVIGPSAVGDHSCDSH